MLNSFSLKFLIATPLLLWALITITNAELSENNLEVNSFASKLDSLNLEKKINRNLFLPEFSINTGLGSEKLIDKSTETEKGPYLFLDGKINLYRGGRDSNTQTKTQTQIEATKLEREIKKRNLNIESFKIVSELDHITKDNQLINGALKSNKIEQAMARKKVDAGLTTSVDLLDFELKNENLSNELEKNNLRIEELKKDLSNLYDSNITLDDLLKSFSVLAKIESTPFTQNEDSPNILLAKKKIELNELDKKNIKAEYLPSVDLEAKWGQITPQEKFFDSNREHQIALNINIPLFSGFNTEGKFQQSIIESIQRKRELKQSEIELGSKRILELKKIEFLKRVLVSNERLLIKAQRYHDLTIGEYKRGIKNSPDVISASDKKLEIERKILETRNELSINQYSFNEIFKPYKEQ